MKESTLQTTIAQKNGYLSWDTMIKSISADGIGEDFLRDLLEQYAIARVIQVKKQLAQEIIDDCNDITEPLSVR